MPLIGQLQSALVGSEGMGGDMGMMGMMGMGGGDMGGFNE